MEIFTLTDPRDFGRSFSDCTDEELFVSFICANACVDTIREIARRGLNERNAQLITAELNDGSTHMLRELLRRGIDPDKKFSFGAPAPASH
ncbi:hypothetical protein G3N59_10485 [Paraburkholderia sp. Ac-20340]|uniref:hypothetical protein n=1 Tax=Paraburkholderia sp. Ac-20340 TaxID=2703888 RepID=UPI00197D0CBD|nr:hypothetical protein [Paraburkholderia sp. Ac-20340]MBN3853807.1 hypothetical protein [Paraburkholderia sp. Ac-20340]